MTTPTCHYTNSQTVCMKIENLISTFYAHHQPPPQRISIASAMHNKTNKATEIFPAYFFAKLPAFPFYRWQDCAKLS